MHGVKMIYAPLCNSIMQHSYFILNMHVDLIDDNNVRETDEI